MSAGPWDLLFLESIFTPSVWKPSNNNRRYLYKYMTLGFGDHHRSKVLSILHFCCSERRKASSLSLYSDMSLKTNIRRNLSHSSSHSLKDWKQRHWGHHYQVEVRSFAHWFCWEIPNWAYDVPPKQKRKHHLQENLIRYFSILLLSARLLFLAQ